MSWRKGIRILIVDDDEDDFFITAHYINNIPGIEAQISWCNNHREALQHILACTHHLYFVDYHLGATSGVDLLKEAARNNSEEAIILLTGQGNYQVDVEAMKSGAIDYLAKADLSTEKLERCMRYAVGRTNILKALRASERKYRTFFEKSKDVVFTADTELNFIDVNDALYHTLGYCALESGKLNIYSMLAAAQQKKEIQEALEENGELLDKEVELLTKDGEKKECLLTISAQAGLHQQDYFQGIIHDITLIKKNERSAMMAEKLAATSRLIRTLAHEVRNPLNNITLSVEQLSEDIKDDTIQDYFSIISRNSNRINELITQLLHTSHPAHTQLQVIPFRSVMHEVIAASADRLTLRHIDLIVEDETKDACIRADKEKLPLALLNIVMNAIEAMENVKGRLKLHAYIKQEQLSLVVQDNGCGISPENISKLFEPYFTQKRNGAGLGLTLTHNILQAHRAHIEVQSEIGYGTRFLIAFPLA